MAKQQHSFSSFADMNKAIQAGLDSKTQQTAPKGDKPVRDVQNFYVYLHKRQRFYPKAIITEKNGRETIHFKKYDIKKIDTDENHVDPQKGKVDVSKKISDFKQFEPNLFFEQFIKRHHRNASNLCTLLIPNDLQKNNLLKFKPDWRLAIGLGTGSIFETAMSLHHVHGFPYIPASSIKGVVRSYLITTIWGMNADSEARAFNESKFMCDIFGCGEETQWKINKENQTPLITYYKKKFEDDKQKFGKDLSKYRFGFTEKSGDCIFFDAYPAESPNQKIKADIMNAHYQPYYSDNTHKTPPADYHKLNPILFLTVENLYFQFMLGLKNGKTDFDIEIGKYKGKALEQLAQILKDALIEHGIGAKTAVGYGYMKS